MSNSLPAPLEVGSLMDQHVDNDPQSAAWMKLLVDDETGRVPKDALFAIWVDNNELGLVYGPKHELYKRSTAKDQPPISNDAIFTGIFEIAEFGTSLTHPLGHSPPEPPVLDWRLKMIQNSIGLRQFHNGNVRLDWINQDVRFAATVAKRIMSEFDPKMKMERGFLYREKGTTGGVQDFSIVRFPPSFVIDPGVTRPRSGGPSPYKAGGAVEPTTEAPPSVYTPTVPTKGGAPGILYTPAAVPGYRPSLFMSKKVLAVQQPVFDYDGNTVLPAELRDVLTVGTIVKASFSYRAWTTRAREVLNPYLLLEKLEVLSAPAGNPVDQGAATTEEDRDSEVYNPQEESTRDDGVKDASQDKVQVETRDAEEVRMESKGTKQNGSQGVDTTKTKATDILELPDDEYDALLASMHPDTSKSRKRGAIRQEGKGAKKRKVTKTSTKK